MATLVLVMASLVDSLTDFQASGAAAGQPAIIRLSLNVSSTRLILTEGQNGKEAAGSVINGFAEFVAGGSILVGITIFAVISVVNFMVITKGSGRMAEVAARFALDSLPGKQLAIDGDLNAGAIDHQEAKRRRIQEQREISFFGSLDGASKFVKGDAVAGIVITLINLDDRPDRRHRRPRHAPGRGRIDLFPPDDRRRSGQPDPGADHLDGGGAAVVAGRGDGHDCRSAVGRIHPAAGSPPPGGRRRDGGDLLVPGMPQMLFMWHRAGAGLYGVAHRQSAEKPIETSDAPAADPAPAARIGDVLDTDDVSVEIGSDLILVALDQARGLGSRIGNLRIHIARSFGMVLPDVRITDTDDLPPRQDYRDPHPGRRAGGAARCTRPRRLWRWAQMPFCPNCAAPACANRSIPAPPDGSRRPIRTMPRSWAPPSSPRMEAFSRPI